MTLAWRHRIPHGPEYIINMGDDLDRLTRNQNGKQCCPDRNTYQVIPGYV